VQESLPWTLHRSCSRSGKLRALIRPLARPTDECTATNAISGTIFIGGRGKPALVRQGLYIGDCTGRLSERLETTSSELLPVLSRQHEVRKWARGPNGYCTDIGSLVGRLSYRSPQGADVKSTVRMLYDTPGRYCPPETIGSTCTRRPISFRHPRISFSGNSSNTLATASSNSTRFAPVLG
jgi:hypothetical protein